MGHGLADAVGHRGQLTSHRHDLNIAPRRPFGTKMPPVEARIPTGPIDCAYAQIANTHPEDQAAKIGIGGIRLSLRGIHDTTRPQCSSTPKRRFMSAT